MKDLFLIYVNKIGKNHRGQFLYEFIFSDTTEEVNGTDWDVYPASGRPEPPNEEFIKKVGVLESDLKFDIIQESDTFAVWDSIDGVVSIAWENINDYDTYPEKRLFFRFGESLKKVEDKLYERDLVINYAKAFQNN